MPSSRLIVGMSLDPAGPPAVLARTQAAERHGLNFVLFEDGGALDPVEAASFAGARAPAVGLVAEAPATHAEPFHLSNQFSSLDRGTAGRAGWFVTVDDSEARARAWSRPRPEREAARREADEVVDAARRLWDSWEDSALIADSVTGRFLDNAKLHYVDAGEEFFRIRGPALMPRPVQGQVVVLARAADGLAGADVLLVPGGAPVSGAGPEQVFVELDLRETGHGAELLEILSALAPRADGVLLRGADGVRSLDMLGRDVLPTLIADGVLVPPRPGQTLREQLGLPRPTSRYAATEVPA